MIVYGVALLAFCTLIGVFLGDCLGVVLGVKANVGGVGLAMILLIAIRVWLVRTDRLSGGIKLGVEFWAGMYIPIVVAMAAQQNVVAALSGGPIVIIAAVASVAICFAAVALLGHLGRRGADADSQHGAVIAGEAGSVAAHARQAGAPTAHHDKAGAPTAHHDKAGASAARHDHLGAAPALHERKG